MELEFDARKSAGNRRKHGIDFARAQALWLDPDRLEIPATTDDEARSMVIGKIGSKHWSAIITDREGRVRLICMRRARREEVMLYES